MADHHVNIDELKAFYKTETSDFDWLYQEAIDAAKQFLNDECHRTFAIAGNTATARSYVPTECNDTLWIHDCTEITSVVENGVTLTANTHYWAHPLNGITRTGESRPYNKLVRWVVPWYTSEQKPTVVVTAKWGWPSLPAGYRMAHFVCAKAHMESRDIRFGLAALSEAGGVTEREAKTVRDFVRHYSTHGVGMVA